MTLEIMEFRCPTCGHLLGKEEYTQAWNEINRIVIERTKEQDALKDEQHRKELQRQELHKESEVQTRVNQILSDMELKYKEDLAKKDREIEAARLEGISD